ncbi:DUF92 domain-containing protein [Taibaiella koreensis]|uniref:DUF92 domain-containing protein n=1 Tax=Taibaiella koreensis TaxID=1268548 RepID=UPI001969413B|nr:DUF92 domain-containing protein [Taibaiella koreensis]
MATVSYIGIVGYLYVMHLQWSLLVAVAVLTAGAFAAVKLRKLTVAAGAAAFVVGLAIYMGGGLTGLLSLAVFFILATWATGHKKKVKAVLEHKGRHQERRKAGQVLANGGVAALAGMLACLAPQEQALYTSMLSGALSSATADTLASELGMVYGRHAVNILSWKREARGLDGVVSLEGTLIGIGGSALIALTDALGHGFGPRMGIIILAGTLGNLADSLLGATLERKHYLNNDLVNTFNTLIAALAVWAMATWL